MSPTVGHLRLLGIRLMFLCTFFAVAPGAWRDLWFPAQPWDPHHGIAVSVWAAFSVLAVLGVFRPLKMLPLLLLQAFYTSLWLLAVALPLWREGALDGLALQLALANATAVVLDLCVIPWGYVVVRYLRAPSANTPRLA